MTRDNGNGFIYNYPLAVVINGREYFKSNYRNVVDFSKEQRASVSLRVPIVTDSSGREDIYGAYSR